MRVKLLIIAIFFLTVMTGCGGSSSNLPANNQQTLEEVPEIEDTPIIEESPDVNEIPESEDTSPKEDLQVQPEMPEANYGDTRRTVTLNNGIEMPRLGIGTYRLSQQEAENSVYWALKAGFRLIDTARIYGNEEGVGRGVKRAVSEGIAKREEIFITTKMWTSDYSDGEAAIEASLNRLGVDYIDLMILHHSQPANDVTAYKSMENALRSGKLRSIGLSNYYTPEDFDRIVSSVIVAPAVLQNETHPYHQSITMKNHIAEYGTVLEAWYPLGGRGYTHTLFNDPVIASIAEAHGKSSAQIIIRWHIQSGNIAIPGSSNEQHIIENFDVWDFSLTDDEMNQIANLERNRRNSTY